jgi:uncharacterized protein YbjT (DUF2867 family)
MVTSASLTLVLGATGKTGSRVASRLRSRGLPVRTAARSGADAHFDWDDPGTYAPALHGARRVYLVGPVMRTDFAGQVSVFLDKAEAAGTRHVTYLSAYGIDSAPRRMGRRRGSRRGASRLRGGAADADRNHRVRARLAAQQ